MEEIKFTDYSEEFLELSWQWLNDPEIKLLTNTPDFTREGQRQWFNGLKDRTDYKVWGMEAGHQKIGVVGLKNIDDSGNAEYFGYIGAKEFWNKGISRQMLAYIQEYARKSALQSIWLRVIKNNPRAINAYHKYGFFPYEETGKEVFMRLNISGDE